MHNISHLQGDSSTSHAASLSWFGGADSAWSRGRTSSGISYMWVADSSIISASVWHGSSCWSSSCWSSKDEEKSNACKEVCRVLDLEEWLDDWLGETRYVRYRVLDLEEWLDDWLGETRYVRGGSRGGVFWHLLSPSSSFSPSMTWSYLKWNHLSRQNCNIFKLQ